MESDPDFTWRPLDAPNPEPGPEPAAPVTEPVVPVSAGRVSAGPAPTPAGPALSPEQSRGAVALQDRPAEDFGGFEVDDVPPPKGRGPASTRYIGVAILVAAAFVGGVAAQKHHDAGYSPQAKGLAAIAAAGAGGGGGGGAPGAAAAGRGGAAGGSGESGAPTLVGTVMKVNGSDVVVRDPGGTVHVVHTSDKTRVARQAPVTDLASGSMVAVNGTPGDDGSVEATSVIERTGSGDTKSTVGDATSPPSR
jgi:hypothetical protein